MIYVLPVSLWNVTIGRMSKKKDVIVEENSKEDVGVNGDSKPTGVGKQIKAEKVAGKRKAKKKN